MTIIDEISKFLQQEVEEKIKANIISTGKEATGKTRKSVNTVKAPGRVFVEAAGHIGNLETGTPPIGYSKSAVNDLWRPPLVRWATAKGLPTKTDGVKQSKYSLTERWTRGIAFIIVDKGSKQFRIKKFTNVFSSEVTSAAKKIPQIGLDAVVAEVHDIVKELS